MVEDVNREEEILLFDDDEESVNEIDGGADKEDAVLLIQNEEEDQPGEAKEKRSTGNQAVRSRISIAGQTVRNGFSTDVDLVFVIDCTGSMEPFLSMVKSHAKTFHQEIVQGLGKKSRQVNKLRVKVIGYRDFYFDWADPDHPPIEESEFFTLPTQQEEYAAFLDKLEYCGGEDEPESALEAMHIAFNSNWSNDPSVNKRRQVILVFTDASAHPLDDAMRYDPEFNAYYPEGVPESLGDLQSEFMSAEVFPADKNGYPGGHRLILFVPVNMEPWNQMHNWPETVCKPMDPEKGLEGVGMEEVITMISGSLG